ncbi:GLPGLI family protein [Aureibaculum marinum]|uniref:GLPGLI family protein n=1 Tax=Aureibaculum marinum TaxID=2487930 RepID=A0A3N4N788_9FLAO|nr:GLPGLI family protein [Aureibaculum marinum]RPD91235.1 GLPGLI family protein [Aureibaculum marinum]
MRILYITIIFLLCFSSGFSQIEQAVINYGVKFSNNKKDSLNKKNSLAYEKFNKIVKQAENIEMELIYKNGSSSFENAKAMYVDDNQNLLMKLAILFSKLRGNYYAKVKDKNVILEKEFNGTNYLILSNFNKYQWKLGTDVRKISGFSCYKATTIKTYISRKGNIVEVPITAWYTPEIPIALGPKDYVGLPGLILSISEGKITYYATKIDLKANKVNVQFPKKGIKITEKEFEKLTDGTTKAWIKERQ